jgi:hypothetical protein
LDRIRNRKNIIALYFGILIVTVIVHLLIKDSKFISGLLWGFTLAYSGLLLFLFLPNHKFSQDVQALSMVNYLFRSVIRMSAILGLFMVMVFVLKVHALGLLGGAFAGMMILSFLFLFKMKPAQ